MLTSTGTPPLEGTFLKDLSETRVRYVIATAMSSSGNWDTQEAAQKALDENPDVFNRFGGAQVVRETTVTTVTYEAC